MLISDQKRKTLHLPIKAIFNHQVGSPHLRHSPEMNPESSSKCWKFYHPVFQKIDCGLILVCTHLCQCVCEREREREALTVKLMLIIIIPASSFSRTPPIEQFFHHRLSLVQLSYSFLSSLISTITKLTESCFAFLFKWIWNYIFRYGRNCAVAHSVVHIVWIVFLFLLQTLK